MTLINSLPESKKMLVIFRVEPGSLGPNGKQYIKEFCDFAQQQLQSHDNEYITWFIQPRLDKQLVEMEFQISSKKLSPDKANKYLNLFGDNLTSFEEKLEDNVDAMIDQYFGR